MTYFDKTELNTLLVPYIKSKVNGDELKTELALYFLWSYYKGAYGTELFPGSFALRPWGAAATDADIDAKADAKPLMTSSKNNISGVKHFADGLLKQIAEAAPLALTARIHQDKAWQHAFIKRRSIISKREITQDYLQYLQEESK